METPTWNNFLTSSKASLCWAAALARCQHAGESLDFSDGILNVFDLFVGLLRAQLIGEEGGDDIEEQPDSQLKISKTHRQILDSIMDFSPSREELGFLGSLVPVLGDTPSSIKRFVNLYQLLRIIHQIKPEDEHMPPSDHQVLVLVLAIDEGLPRLASPLFRRLSKVYESATFSDITKEFKEFTETSFRKKPIAYSTG